MLTPAEFKTARETLGYSVNGLASHLGVGARRIREWESGKRDIPPAASLVMNWWANNVVPSADEVRAAIPQYINVLFDAAHDGGWIYYHEPERGKR